MEDGCIAKFWAYGRDLQEESKFKGALKQLLNEFRRSLDNSSPLAKAIDNKESSEIMALLAGKEKYPQLAEILFMDTLEGNKRKAKRRLALGRRQGGGEGKVCWTSTPRNARFPAGQTREEIPQMKEEMIESGIFSRIM